MDYARQTRTPPATPLRLLRCIWRQKAHTPVCPLLPRLEGKRALVTGGNAGMGLEISRGLAKRGAQVIIAARNASTSKEACRAIAAETGATPSYLPLDLSDLGSVVAATDQLKEPLHLVVANAGVWPRAYAPSAQGHELAFATNTLGHHVLLRRLLDRGLLGSARVVMVTGDIYIRARECTSDFKFEGQAGGAMAYSRSKLGSLWLTFELQRRYPELEVCAVHPGVVLTGRGGPATGLSAFVQKRMMLDAVQGAQTPLWCATQPIVRGAYYHNTMGRLTLGPGDPAANAEEANRFWLRLEELSAAFRGGSVPRAAQVNEEHL